MPPPGSASEASSRSASTLQLGERGARLLRLRERAALERAAERLARPRAVALAGERFALAEAQRGGVGVLLQRGVQRGERGVGLAARQLHAGQRVPDLRPVLEADGALGEIEGAIEVAARLREQEGEIV